MSEGHADSQKVVADRKLWMPRGFGELKLIKICH